MVGVGIAWASILAMPYAILTGSLPPSKMGYYMGVFNFFIVIPQIVAAALLGFFVGRFFGGEAIYALADRRRLAPARRGADAPGARTGTTWTPAHEDRHPRSSRLIGLGACLVGVPARCSRRGGDTRRPGRRRPVRRSSGTAPPSTSCSPTASTTATPRNDHALGRAQDGALLRNFEGGDLAGVARRRSRRATSTAWGWTPSG